jgi:hypothetical protein
MASGLVIGLGWLLQADATQQPIFNDLAATGTKGQMLRLMEAVSTEIWLLVLVLSLSAFSFALSLMLGGRISSSDVTRFFLYTNGATTLISAAFMLFSSEPSAVVVITLLLLWIYVAIAVLYTVTRKRLFGAQIGATLLILGAVVAIILIAALAVGAGSGA